jgi:UvrB/uvrC motif.
MKKVGLDFIGQLIFALAGIVLMLGGAVIFVASFFTIMSVVTGIFLMALGAILFNSVRLYFMFLETIEIATAAINSSTKFHTGLRPGNEVAVQEIIINSDTPPEEIIELKNKFPMLSKNIDDMIMQMHGKDKLENFFANKGIFKKDVKELSISQLEEAIKIAISNEDYEKAANYRNEINSRKNNLS